MIFVLVPPAYERDIVHNSANNSREDYVDGVEVLLRFEEENHVEGEKYSWEAMDSSVANFTADITPLILAAHR